ncbi:MAG: MltA domain-containing protein [Neisseriaceae bacterium]|nr:MltA domain-containing protein [Neisseriaceae bacterium]
MNYRLLLSCVATVLIIAGCSTPQTVPTTPTPQPVTPETAPPPISTPRYPVGQSFVSANGGQYTATDYTALPSWVHQNFSGSLKSFQNSCRALINQPQWAEVCRIAQATPQSAAKAFFEQNFTPWTVSQNGQLAGTVTGYYEPGLSGDFTQTATAKYPIYGVPNDFVTVPYSGQSGRVKIAKTGENSGVISPNGSYIANTADFPNRSKSGKLKGRFSGSQFVPYYTRAQINASAINGKAPIIAYADNAVELFFLHIQGSGRLITPNGQTIRLSFADKNDHNYVSIGKYMADKGYLPLSQTSMQGIKQWIATHPEKLAEVLGQNPSFIFFSRQDNADEGPNGALGVPLTGGFSAAVDRRHIVLGSPIFVATTDPRNGKALNRLMMAQDTGSAINGAVRIDFFWGFGDEAGQIAGKMKHTGYVWTLLPNGMQPMP